MPLGDAIRAAPRPVSWRSPALEESPQEILRSRILALLSTGKSEKEIAIEFGMTVAAVDKVIRRIQAEQDETDIASTQSTVKDNAPIVKEPESMRNTPTNIPETPRATRACACCGKPTTKVSNHEGIATGDSSLARIRTPTQRFQVEVPICNECEREIASIGELEGRLRPPERLDQYSRYISLGIVGATFVLIVVNTGHFDLALLGLWLPFVIEYFVAKAVFRGFATYFHRHVLHGYDERRLEAVLRIQKTIQDHADRLIQEKKPVVEAEIRRRQQERLATAEGL